MIRAVAVVLATLISAFVATAQSTPRTLVVDGALLEKRRTEFAAGKSGRSPEIAALIKAADKILEASRTYSVTKKTQRPRAEARTIT